MNIRGISGILQFGMDLIGDVVKKSTEIKIEQAKYTLEEQKRNAEFGRDIARTGLKTGQKVLETAIETIADNQKKKVDIEAERTQSEVEIKKAEADEELIEKRMRFEQEMEELQKDSELQRRKDILQTIQTYQIEVTKVMDRSMLILAGMPLELQEKAEGLLREEKESYERLKQEWENNAIGQVERIEKSFANNKKMKDRLQETIWSDVERMIQLSQETLERMEKDIEKINENARNFSIEGKKMVQESFKSMQIGSESQYLLEDDIHS